MIDEEVAALGMDGELLARSPEIALPRAAAWPPRRERRSPTSDPRDD